MSPEKSERGQRAGRGAGDAERGGNVRGGKPKKAGGTRRTRQKARITKKTGDVRSKPETRGAGGGGPVTGGGIRYLRGLGHHLDAVVQIGKEGITDALVAATNEALRAHELIKVKVGSESPVDRKEAGPELAQKTGATLAQVLGRTLLLYKRHPSKPKIELPR
jgi:RNA-binding protein